MRNSRNLPLPKKLAHSHEQDMLIMLAGFMLIEQRLKHFQPTLTYVFSIKDCARSLFWITWNIPNWRSCSLKFYLYRMTLEFFEATLVKERVMTIFGIA